ncbi:MAG: rod shape-determining protein RodA [Lachnospiraceae bacterium]|nr:rod shape-determining protein RodA [Lachnospiraceae bacterium]
MFKKYKLKNFDFILVFLVVLLNIIGIFAIGSAKESVQNKQIFGMILGLCIMMVIAFMDYSVVLKFYWLIYMVMIGSLLLVEFFGETVNGATRWLDLGFFQFQPSDTTKILLILFYAQFIMKYKEKLNSFRVLSAVVALAAPPLLLVIKQPDLSTTILLVLLFCVIVFSGGLSWKIIGSILAVAVPCVLIFLSIVVQEDQTLLENYQRNRIMAFIDPEAYADAEAYQQLNSVIAIGSGQLWGKGLNNNEIASVKNGNFLPEPQTDFIFAVIGEELGFIGSAAVILLLIFIAMRCVSAGRTAKDSAGMIIGCGMGALVAFQGFMNIAVATMLMPNTGLPLPFVSYGLSSLVSLYAGIGFVLNVRLQRKNLYNL